MMPSVDLAGARTVVTPPEAVTAFVRDYPSPDGVWNLRFHSPWEWRMGAEGWQLTLLRSMTADPEEHTGLGHAAQEHGVRLAEDLQPWRRDSAAVALLTWGANPLFFYDLERHKGRAAAVKEGFPFSAQWARGRDCLLVTCQTAALLFSGSLEVVARTPWKIGAGQSPKAFWLGSGECFFLLAKPPRGKTKITFFAADTGRRIADFPLDPLDLLPYDHAKYARVPRQRSSLIIDQNTSAAGLLLDVWHRVCFDAGSGRLHLATYRPTGEPTRRESMLACPVEERWAAVDVAP